jgi:hypothetical protein
VCKPVFAITVSSVYTAEAAGITVEILPGGGQDV